MQIITQRARKLLRPLAIPKRRERESFEQTQYIKLKNFFFLPEATGFCGQRECGNRGN